jgi:hypothetical protein
LPVGEGLHGPAALLGADISCRLAQKPLVCPVAAGHPLPAGEGKG